MPAEGTEEQASLSSPASAALTLGWPEDEGAARGKAPCSFPENTQGSEAAAAYPTCPGPGDNNNGESFKELYSIYEKANKNIAFGKSL